MVTITDHGEKRIRKRLGLPVRATGRLAAAALAKGRKRTDYSGALRRYLDMLYHKGRGMNGAQNIVVYNDYVFLFAGETLITTWALPPKFRGRK